MVISPLPPAKSLLQKAYRKAQAVYDKQIDGTGLAIFRIVFCTVLLAEIGHIFYFRALIFDAIPFIEPAEIDFTLPLLLWMGAVLLLLLGLYTRPAAVANYGFSLLFFSSVRTYAYMMTPVYVTLAFLFLFLPLGQCCSLDRLRRTLRYSTTQLRYTPPRTVSQLAYYAPLLLCLAFVYLDSTFYKLTSPLWLKGLGMWLPLSMPFETQLNTSLLLNTEWLVKTLGYLTLAFEVCFLFLFPLRRYRAVLLLIGLGLHLGILLTFTFPLFALGFGSLYILLVPVSFWRRLLACRARYFPRPLAWALRTPGGHHLGKAVYGWVVRHHPANTRDDQPARLPLPAVAGPAWGAGRRHAAKRALVLGGLAGLVLLQGIASYNTPLLLLLRRKSGLESTGVGQVAGHVAAAVATRARTLFGITNHPIALDEHFAGYTRLVAVTYTSPDGVERFLPITRPSGQPGAYLYGVVWLKWTYLIVSHQINQGNLETGLRSFTAFWAHHHHVALTNCRFRVKVKKLQEATNWQPNLLNEQLAAGWVDAGTVDWQQQQFTAHLVDVNTL